MRIGSRSEPEGRGSARLWAGKEQGMSDAASAIFILPIIAFLIFALVDLGVNFHYRSKVDRIVQETVRSISYDGSKYWARTTVVPDGYDETSFSWETWGFDQLEKLCGADGSRCDGSPTMKCTIADTVDVDGFVVAKYKNTEVSCEASFPYDPVSPLSKSPVTSLGFNGLLTSDIKSSSTGLTSVGYNG